MYISSRFIAAASVAAVSFAIAAPASAAPLFHEHFHDSFSEEIDDFCGLDGVIYTVDAHGVTKAATRGSGELVYFLENVHGSEAWTNPETGRTYTHVFNATIRDQAVTDNGDGTLTILVYAAGGDRWYDADGKLFLRDPGSVRFEILVDHGGTPSDPSDDEFLEFLGVVKESTGLNEAADRDFCEDFLLVTG